MSNSPVILLVDDNEEDRQYFVQRLGICSSDFVILHAATGQAALDLHKRQPIDCFVLEPALPDMEGFELLVKLVPRVWHPENAVIVLTRIANRYLREASLKNGAQAAFYKPMTSGDMLYSAIIKALATVPKDRKQFPT